MSPRKEISISMRMLVGKHRKDKKSFSDIAQLLILSKATVQTINKSFEETSSFESNALNGRIKKPSRRDIQPKPNGFPKQQNSSQEASHKREKQLTLFGVR